MLGLVIGKQGKDRLRSLLRKLGLGVLLVALALALTYTAFRRWTLLTPPEDEGPALPPAAKVVVDQGVSRLAVGESWMARRQGLWRLHLTGGPREMGHAHGLLAGRVTAQIDRHMVDLMGRYVTTPFRRWLVGNLVRWQFRELPEAIPPRRLVELAAFSRTIVDTSEFPEAPFQRMVYYHALHDMTQRLDGSPIIGCTAFAAWGVQTVDEHLIVGRNFDFEGGPIFDREKAVLSVKTPGRIPFVSVAWPGMMGVVTGVNAKRLYVSINAARTDEPLQPGIPMAFLVREILERAGSVKEALAVVKEYKVMVAEGLLIADGKVPEAAVLELSPAKVVVRRGSSGLIGLTNHFVDRRYKADASNDRLKRYTTSAARYKRLRQLLERFGGRIDARTGALILRNRTAYDDEPLGLGNRNAIDALIATHGVVVDLTQMVLWVSRGPHLLSEFVAVDLKSVFGIPVKSMEPVEAIPADNLNGSDELARYRMAREQMKHAETLAQGGKVDKALDYAGRAAGTLADSPDARKLLGDLLWSVGKKGEAREHYKKFLKLQPPYLREVEIVKARLTE
jgi:isopenicillin-N N-acyltransferase-like protein